MSKESSIDSENGGDRRPRGEPFTCEGEVDRRLFTAYHQPQTFPRSMQLIGQGALAEDVYFIDQGWVKLVYVSLAGNEEIVGLRSSGWVVGAAAAIAKMASPISAVALTECQVVRIPASDFRELLERDSQLSKYLHQVSGREILDHLSLVIGLGSHSARERLERFLGEIAAARGDTAEGEVFRLHLPLSHKEIAQFVSVTPQHLCQLWKQMEADGVISRDKGWILFDWSKVRQRGFGEW